MKSLGNASPKSLLRTKMLQHRIPDSGVICLVTWKGEAREKKTKQTVPCQITQNFTLTLNDLYRELGTCQ